jgi:hypothetical protein
MQVPVNDVGHTTPNGRDAKRPRQQHPTMLDAPVAVGDALKPNQAQLLC